MEHVESSNSATEIPASPQETKPNGHAAASETPIDIARKTMVGDLVGLHLETLSELRDAWHKLPENQQKRHRARAQGRFARAVNQAVGIIAADGCTTIEVAFEHVAFEAKGIKLKFSLSFLDKHLRHALLAAHGQVIRLQLPKSALYSGERPSAQESKSADEPELPLPGSGEDVDLNVNTELSDTESEARKTGRQNGYEGNRDRAASWPPGEEGHADYALGHEEGRQEREAAIAKARDEGEAARLAGADRAVNPYPPGSKWNEAWLTGWIAEQRALPAPAPDEDQFHARGESPGVEAGGSLAAKGHGLDQNPYDPDGQPYSWARFIAGWWSQTAQQSGNDELVVKDAEHAIRGMGATAGNGGKLADDCPFPTRWPERGLWLKGWAETIAAKPGRRAKVTGEPTAPARRGRPRKSAPEATQN